MRAEGDTNTNVENQELICSNCKTPMQNGCRLKDKTVPAAPSDATGNDQKLWKSFNEGTNIATDHQTHSSSAEDVCPPFASSSVCIQQLHSTVNLFSSQACRGKGLPGAVLNLGPTDHESHGDGVVWRAGLRIVIRGRAPVSQWRMINGPNRRLLVQALHCGRQPFTDGSRKPWVEAFNAVYRSSVQLMSSDLHQQVLFRHNTTDPLTQWADCWSLPPPPASQSNMLKDLFSHLLSPRQNQHNILF